MFYIFRFTNIATAVTNMGNKDLDKKQLRISSSGTDMDFIESAQDGDYIKMTLTDYQSLILRSTAIKELIELKFEKKFLAWKLDWMKLKWKYKP